ncbi:hypothetical protein [Leptospira adleri]|nr:hypothetical protein [Leptospira adleri]
MSSHILSLISFCEIVGAAYHTKKRVSSYILSLISFCEIVGAAYYPKNV